MIQIPAPADQMDCPDARLMTSQGHAQSPGLGAEDVDLAIRQAYYDPLIVKGD